MIGIENVHEFYTHHYLASILASDVRPHVARWREAEGPTPWQRLAQLQRAFFRTSERLATLRSPAERVEAHLGMASELLDALGYPLRPVHREIDAGPLPLLSAWTRGDGEPLLWLLPVASAQGAEDADDGDLLARRLLREQHRIVPGLDAAFDPGSIHQHPIEALITDAFQQEEPPRFVLVVGEREWILADRGKWAEQRLLRFDLAELLGRRDPPTLETVTAILHRETLAPESGTSVVDVLDDSSHKHAYEVSEDLKYALQASIEAIGNEAIRFRREKSKRKIYGEEIDGQELAIECIRYMYRILFLLYVEARPELGYAPMGSEAYRLGYSFERLRDLEMLELETEEAREGTTLHEFLARLFEMVYQGTPEPAQLRVQAPAKAEEEEDEAAQEAAGLGSLHYEFRLAPLKSHLFDPARTPFLNQVKLRNAVLLEVIRSMSLSKPQGRGRHKRRGRISYATLGINQLGAVYEALLSFRGFFAEETLYEVKPAKIERPDPIQDPAFFVPESELAQYKKAERVFDGQQLRAYPPGSFIYRIAGRDRQKSASYYTPEVLTRSLVKYALMELLEDENGEPRHARAQELLELTICEPAMGSAAFLNEAINQLAEIYLLRRQQELGERIPHERYAQELQRVRMYLADNNVYGVDLNPVAVELAEVSLWLNAIFSRDAGIQREVFIPWFGGQLGVGNSLVGAWRKVYSAAETNAGPREEESPWLDAVPRRVPLGEARPEGSIYHFLLPDRGMAVYGQGSEGKPIRELRGEALKTFDRWRKEACAPLSAPDRAALVRLSDAADRLWTKHAELLAAIRRRTTDPLSVYGFEHPRQGHPPTSTREKDRIWRQEMESEQVRASSPYRRLKLVMDYWCALWFWPIEEADLLPDRDEWLTDLALLLDTDVLPALDAGDGQRELFPSTMPAQEARRLAEEVGFADVEGLLQRLPRLALADRLAHRYRFHHWELELADVFAQRGGFDLVLGNPPWIPVLWKEADVLADDDPSFVIHKLSAKQTSEGREAALDRPGALAEYLAAHEEPAGLQSFLSAKANYPQLAGIKANLYKAFLPVSWALNGDSGVTGLLHPDGLYDDPKAGIARRAAYARLRRHYQFVNEMHLFAEVHHQTLFALNVYGAELADPAFLHLSNLFLPATIDECHAHPGIGPVPGIKDEDNQWETRGHAARIIEVTEEELALFARLYDEPDTAPSEARLPALHSTELVEVLQALATASLRLGDSANDDYVASSMWDESRAQKARGDRDPTIRHEVRFPESASEWVISGPHFFVGNPFYKSPRAEVSNNSHYDVLDLLDLPDDYLPRTLYVPAVGPAEYRSRAPKVPWASAEGRDSVVDYYRVVVNRGLGATSERTVQPAIIPPGPGHINGVYTYTLSEERRTILTAASWAALPVDFFIKTTGAGDFFPNLARRLPIIEGPPFSTSLVARILSLVCLTTDYAPLWNRHHEPAWRAEATPFLERSQPGIFSDAGNEWSRESAVRSPRAAGDVGGDRCVGGDGVGIDPGTAANPLPRAIPRPALLRSRHLVRPARPHRLHQQPRPHRRRPPPLQIRRLPRRPLLERRPTPRRRSRPHRHRNRHPNHPRRHPPRRPAGKDPRLPGPVGAV